MNTKVTNSFIKGINQDLAVTKYSNTELFSALNIDIITDTGESTGIISNHKGNKFQFRIPDVLPLYSLTLIPPVSSITNQININGVLVTVNLSPQSTPEDIYNQLLTDFTIVGQINAGLYGIYFNSKAIIIQSYSVDVNPVVTIGTNLTVSTILNTQSDLSIIGWGTLEEEIVLLTTPRTNDNPRPVNTSGQVWVINYDDATNVVTNLNAGSLNPAIHLKYNNILNFSLFHEIERETIGRKESSLRGNFYWTDNYNLPRVINLYNPQCPAIPVELLDWKPSVNLSTPIIEEVLPGGLLNSGKYQVTYQLYTKDGAFSNYSPCSKLVPITDSSLSGPYYLYDGAEVETPSGKSLKVNVNNIDLNYDFVRVVLIEYSVIDVPIINVVYDVSISGSSMQFIISGGEDKIAISIEEFTNPLIFFDTVKTFTQKKNKLYPANVTTRTFEVNYDARAYRFNNSQVALLFSKDGSSQSYDATIPADLAALYSLDDSADAVNPYNDESGQVFGLIPTNNYSDWENNYQYKYQTDGSTLGGEGPNVSYKFVIQEIRADEKFSFPFDSVSSIGNIKDYYRQNAPFVSVGYKPTSNFNFGTPPFNDMDYFSNNWQSLKDPIRASLFNSYARGEVYRHGVVFYNDKGEESFVNWIADIRIPEYLDGVVDPTDHTSDARLIRYDESSGDTRLYVKAIGIEFTFRNLPANISGLRIVRVKREKQDKTRFGTGIIFGLLDSKIELSGVGLTDCYHLISFSNQDTTNIFANDPHIPLMYINNDFSPGEAAATGGIPSAPAYHGNISSPADLVKKVNNGLCVIKFPELDFNNYELSDATNVRFLEGYSFGDTSASFLETYFGHIDGGGRQFFNQGVVYWSSIIDGGARPAGAFFIKLTHPKPTIGYSFRTIPIINQTIVDIESVVPSSFSPTKMAGKDYHHIAIYTLPETETGTAKIDWQLSGFATKALFCDLDITPNPKTPNFTIVSLTRFNFGQYGGPWRSARYNNNYIAASDYIPKSLIDNTAQSIRVFGGDVYVNYYSTTMSFFHWKFDYQEPNATASGLGQIYDPVARSMSALALCFPAESSINTEYRDKNYWNKNQVFTNDTSTYVSDTHPIHSGTDFPKFLADEYSYNTAYSQENNLKVYFPKPFNFNTDQELFNWVVASERKFDREIQDSWRKYLPNSFIALEGNYGPINKIITLKESIIAFQTRASAIVSSEEISAVHDAVSNAVFQIGTGRTLARYDYYSKVFGSFHQHSVITGPAFAYFIDSRTKKLFKIGEGIQNITDVKGLSAYYRKKLQGAILVSDNILLNTGIHGAYDSKYNKVYYTFLNTFDINYSSISQIPGTSKWVLNNYSPSNLNILDPGDILTIGNNQYQVDSISQTQLTLNVIEGSITRLMRDKKVNYKFTLAYNEVLQAFESFYSFTPTMYLPTDERLLSVNPFTFNNSVYLHNEGDYGVFYDKAPVNSVVSFIINFPEETKAKSFRIDTLNFWTEVFDANGIDIPLETITGIVIENDYQSTQSSLLVLTPQQNVVRRERGWRINHIRDHKSTLPIKPFLRDVYAKITIYYNNSNNRTFRLNDFTTNITLSYF